MAAGSNEVDIRVVAHDLATKTIKGVDKGLRGIGKGLLGIASAGGAVKVLAGVAAAGQQLLPVALALPGALLAGAAAAGTFKVATAGFADALKAEDAAAFAEATRDMAPAMRDTAAAVRELKDGPLKALRQEVQGKFWAGFSDEVRALGGIYIPKLKQGMGDIAGEMNGVGKSLSAVLKQADVAGSVDKIFGDTADTIHDARDALGKFVGGFVKLGAVGSAKLPRLGSAIDRVAQKWSDFVDKGTADGSIDRMIEDAISGFKDLGAIVKNAGSAIGSFFRGISGGAASPLASLRELTGRVAEFMRSFEAQEALREFGVMLREVARVTGDVFMTAMRELAPIVRELSPVVAEVARALGETLKGAIEVLGPILLDLARWMRENKELMGNLAQAVLVAWAAFKGYTVLRSVATAISGVVVAAGGVGAPGLFAVGAALGVIAGVAGIGIVANQLDDLNMAAVGGDVSKLSDMGKELHQVANTFDRIAVGDFGGAFAIIGDEIGRVVREFKTGSSAAGEFAAWLFRIQTGFRLEPIEFKVETGPAMEQVNLFMRTVSSITPTVNINGNTNEAGFALRTILQEIAAGHESVIIDGKPMPAQEALRMVMDMISNSAGDVTINGNTIPAGEALAQMLQQILGSHADLSFGADTSGANSSLNGFVSYWNGYTINMNAVVSSRIGGLAKGGNAGGGLTWVGERGPEMVRYMAGGGNRGRGRTLVGERGPELLSLPPGSQVTPAGRTRAMLTAAADDMGPRAAEAVRVMFGGGLDQAFAAAFMRLVREGKITVRASS